MERLEVIKKLIDSKITITTMESCTGGRLISTITDVEGSSDITEGGYVTYSNNQKIKVGVNKDIIDKYGVYSLETAEEMAKVCKGLMKCDIGIGITGTLSNIDKHNIDSTQGVVYYCIIYDDKKILKKLHVDVGPRYIQKDFIVDNILDELNKITAKLL